MTVIVTGRIKPGARCMQDHSFFAWPPLGVDPDIRFTFSPVRSNARAVDARAPGFGEPGNYGNGSIYVYAPRKP